MPLFPFNQSISVEIEFSTKGQSEVFKLIYLLLLAANHMQALLLHHNALSFILVV